MADHGLCGQTMKRSSRLSGVDGACGSSVFSINALIQTVSGKTVAWNGSSAP